MYGLLEQVVQSWNGSNQGGGQFAVEEDGAVFHIVPTEVRDKDGNWQSVHSILAARISLPTEPAQSAKHSRRSAPPQLEGRC
jgi:hypothetical protein